MEKSKRIDFKTEVKSIGGKREGHGKENNGKLPRGEKNRRTNDKNGCCRKERKWEEANNFTSQAC